MKKNKQNIYVRIPKEIYEIMLSDLNRPHPFASERVGFLSTAVTILGHESKIVTISEYHSLKDEEYIDDPSVGAKISGNTIREAMERIMATGKGCLHVHLHDHTGKPYPSFTDNESLPEVSKAFHNAKPDAANGYIIFSKNSAFCAISTNEEFELINPEQINVIGYPFFQLLANSDKFKLNNIFTRQSFLGENSQQQISTIRIGVVGLGGGGSHIVQQLAHLGFEHFSIFDGDHIEDSNHNRLIGGWFSDIAVKTKKTIIARRVIQKINPKAKVQVFSDRWQAYSEDLKRCDIIVGCVDSYNERSQLEAACRSVLIPYIDIGMDVHKIPEYGISMSGQIILSLPGSACMHCMQFITEKNLSEEAAKYGEAGGRPQVVWPNGVLASTAVGIIVDLVTGWTKTKSKSIYLSYDGESGHISDNPRVEYAPLKCTHFKIEQTGTPVFRKI